MAAGGDAVGQHAFVEDGGELGAREVDGGGVGGGAGADDDDAGVHGAARDVEGGWGREGGGRGVLGQRGGGGDQREGDGGAERRSRETVEGAGKQGEGWEERFTA